MVSPDVERRQHKRLKHPFTARFRIKPKVASIEESKWDIVKLRDLSIIGISFKYHKKIPLGTALELALTLPLVLEPLHLAAVVCRVDEKLSKSQAGRRTPVFTIAALFSEVKNEQKEAITTLVDKFYS